MRNDGDRKNQHRGSSASVNTAEGNKELDNWGVEWIESCRKIRDAEPVSGTKLRTIDCKA